MINRQKHIAFANDYVKKPPEFWKNVLLLGESKFCFFGIKFGRIVSRKSGTALNKEKLLPTMKHVGEGVGIFGCLTVGCRQKFFVSQL